MSGVTDEQLLGSLRATAKMEADEGEFGVGQHSCWLAADRIEELQADRQWLLYLIVGMFHNFHAPKDAQEALILECPQDYSDALLGLGELAAEDEGEDGEKGSVSYMRPVPAVEEEEPDDAG